ncbi:MAG: ADP-forming succinate--CoA ligase subunit beta [Candidatus Altiarchaeota archaeon]
MKLQEYEAKDIFREFAIPVQEGYVIESPKELRKIEKPIVLKAQVLVGGRGKAGGVKFARTNDEARKKAVEIIGMDIKGLKVEKLLVAEAVDIKKEYYVGFIIDRSQKKLVLMISAEGGMDIEEVAAKTPEKIVKLEIDPLKGLFPYQVRTLVGKIGIKRKELSQISSIAYKLYQAAVKYDAEIVEINPLAQTQDDILAIDAKFVIDDNSLFRHPELAEKFKASDEYTDLEKEAKDAGLSYVELEGDIGVIGCGAGLVMASLDAINTYGGKPANFLDVGGGANAENVRQALDIILQKKGVKSVFINVFGGITKCDEVAQGIVDANPGVPLSIRMMGTNEEEGKNILKKNKLEVFDSMEEAAKKAVELAK